TTSSSSARGRRQMGDDERDVAVTPEDEVAVCVSGKRDLIICGDIQEHGGINVAGGEDGAGEGIEGWLFGLVVEDLADDLGAGFAAGDLDVQAGVAVDDVVAAAARPEQDVAAREGHRAGREVVGKPEDQVDVAELVERIDLGVVGAQDEV